MRKLILLAVLGTAAIGAENYVVTLDNKHYEKNIIVDNGNNSNNPINEPFDETKGYMGFTLIHTKASTSK